MASVASLQQAVSALEGRLATAEATQATQEAQLAATTALVATTREDLAAAKRALRKAEDEVLKQLVLAPLFPELVALVFQRVPVDTRLRCREVSRGWCAFLADARHWQVCDLSATSGVARRTLSLLRAASERAQGTLRELDVSAWFLERAAEGEEQFEREQLLPILRSNSASLLELRTWKPVGGEGRLVNSAASIEELLAAAPRLRLLECNASLRGEEARGPMPRLLREPQFAPLRLQSLVVVASDAHPPLDVPALAAWAATHTSLKRFVLNSVQLDNEHALGAVVNLAISKLQYLGLSACHLSPASLPALTRLLKESRTLSVLRVYNHDAPLLTGAALPAFCAELRESRMVQLDLCYMRLWDSLMDGLAIIVACAGHRTLREIDLKRNGLDGAPGRAAIEAALDALEVSIPGLRLIRR